jgi:hypothetical protein
VSLLLVSVDGTILNVALIMPATLSILTNVFPEGQRVAHRVNGRLG